MVTIAGNGMGDYDFSNLNFDISKFDKIICDPNFKEEAKNILKLKYKDAKQYLLDNYDKEEILYVVTGSPLFFSAGTIIAKSLPTNSVKLINNSSSKTYLLEKLFISELDVDTISLHGRDNFDLQNFLQNKYTFVVCDKNTISRLKIALSYFESNSIKTTIGYKLGFEDEEIKEIDLINFDENSIDLNAPFVLLIKKEFEQTNIISEDVEFETERGMITKKYKRQLTLQNLDLEPNQLLWDIGAGSGSCAIEAFKRYKVKTTLFEKNETRVEFIKQNLKNHYVTETKLFVGEAQEYFNTLEEVPQRIFVGGGGVEVIKQLPKLYELLDNKGIMLINAITLKHLNLMLTVLNEAKIEYEIHSISLTTYKGKLDLVEPERQLFQIKINKNEEE
ncbi:precorrin-6Y C5,15-methyltransferase (decarboxylating) subunit CbiT [Malaciobacter molluscorum LMG 25693]|uniref:Cobalt-precorrin-6B (C15)-methyltransferase / cobalt-precorrin-7 (C5)-methyltransferase n=1 Tax=Malaciobacter molluscorum LMG 25693 TaxID=870501 RepID=A0A2G1DGK8_9BACT|nr:precorrin-6Y C5,15-methyltransferase (decarboxylating) subunit CbiT [Malaciobacter molluscorum]AXX92514.1 cobalt-precorrin-6B (C15)-methyltransferase / cobalt-precorrin-7 (C5)-methyltransferase [Malaciobacter molluscorum LMG 25693]PHO17617.1 precorrin-6Y C5,15-methyltransferase (decarboxylating) subunit CbiT [Malaciobacter molluscorum LMG 25693]RXJ93485.1 precorrin-6Y C5,15-methyltransferase (decarboxylating) subunit CbiT [Malaciobacter molluscorum]